MASAPTQQFPPSYLQEYNGNSLRDVAIAFTVLIIIVVALRFYARSLSKVKIGADDLLVVPSMITCLGIVGLALYDLHHGIIGRHFAYIIRQNPALGIEGLKHLIVYNWLYNLSIACAKLSILTFLLRIFPSKAFRTIVYTVMLLVCSLCIANVTVITFQCMPVQDAWNPVLGPGHCIDTLAFFRWSSLPNSLIDLIMLVIPLPMVWSLQTSTGQKVGLSSVFVTGGVGIIASCVRMSVFFKKDAFVDQSWTAVTLIIWTIIEPSVYIMAACLPSLRILVKPILPWARSLPGSFSRSSKRPNRASHWGDLAGNQPDQAMRLNRSWTPDADVSSAGDISEGGDRKRWTPPHLSGAGLKGIKVRQDYVVAVENPARL